MRCEAAGEGGRSRRLPEPLCGFSAPRMLQRFAYRSAYPGAYPYVSSSVCAHVWYVLGLAAWGGLPSPRDSAALLRSECCSKLQYRPQISFRFATGISPICHDPALRRPLTSLSWPRCVLLIVMLIPVLLRAYSAISASTCDAWPPGEDLPPPRAHLRLFCVHR